jgi:hypothetical protein
MLGIEYKLAACSRDGHIEAPPVLEQLADVICRVAAHERHYDDVLVTALEAIDGMHLNAAAAVMRQTLLYSRYLCPVWAYHPNVPSFHAADGQRGHSGGDDVGLSGVCIRGVDLDVVSSSPERCCAEKDDGQGGAGAGGDVRAAACGTEGRDVRGLEDLSSDRIAAALECVVVGDAAAQAADRSIHAVLQIQTRDGVGMQLAQAAKQGVLQSSAGARKGGELEVVADEDCARAETEGGEDDGLGDLRRLVDHNAIEAHRSHLGVSLRPKCYIVAYNVNKNLTCTPRHVQPITQPVLAYSAAAGAAAEPFIRSMTSIIGPVTTCSSIAECTLSLRPTLCTGTPRRLMARSILSTAACVWAVTRMVLP